MGGRITIRSAESLPVLDFRTLSDEQLETAEDIFEEFRGEGSEAGVHRGRRPEPGSAGQAGCVRSAGVRSGDLRGGAAAICEVVRGAVGAWGEAEAEGDGAGGITHRKPPL